MTLQTDHYVDIRGFSELAGVKSQTIRAYRHRGILPAADAIYGNSPVWLRTTVDEWLKTRRRPGKPPN